MTAGELIKELQKFPSDWVVLSQNGNGDYRQVEKLEKDDNYDDLLIVAGGQE
ncbi:MAG: hypothetical protein MJZ26_02320 [Fibrobacter sp.]|nr:hypothetical protein [Fibrobacter sp.]